MEKFFKVFICILIVACIGWAVYSGIDFLNKQKADQKRADEMFTKTWNSEEVQKELQEHIDNMEKAAAEYKEKTDQSLKLMAEADAALGRGDKEEYERLMEEIRNLYGEEVSE